MAAEKVAGLARKATKVAGVANIAATSTGHKGRRCRFFRYTGCIEDHAAAACKEFWSLNKEAKKKAREDSELCKFCLTHSIDTECYGKGFSSKLACQVPNCKGPHTKKLDKMMADLTLTINTVVNEQEEEEEGYVNMARGEHHGEYNRGWRMQDDSWLEMEVEEETEMFYVNVLVREEEEDGGRETARDNVRGKGAGPVKKGVETEGKCTLQKKRRAKHMRVNSEEVDWEKVRRDVWLRDLLSCSTDEEDVQEPNRERLEGKEGIMDEEVRKWMCKADTTTGREVENGASDRADGEWERANGMTGHLVTDKVIKTLVLLEEKTCTRCVQNQMRRTK